MVPNRCSSQLTRASSVKSYRRAPHERGYRTQLPSSLVSSSVHASSLSLVKKSKSVPLVMRHLQAASLHKASLDRRGLLLSVDPSVPDLAGLASGVAWLTLKTVKALARQSLPVRIQGRLAATKSNPFGDIDRPATAPALNFLLFVLRFVLLPIVSTNLHLEVGIADGAGSHRPCESFDRGKVEALSSGEFKKTTTSDVVANKPIRVVLDPAPQGLSTSGSLVVVPHSPEEEFTVHNLGLPGFLDGNIAGAKGYSVVHVELL